MSENCSILYVEDEKHIRDELVEILELDYPKLYVATNGEEGLKLFREHRPDIVVSDMQMPKMDGLTMCRHIKEIDSKVPIIVTTAFNEQRMVSEAKSLDIRYYVTKPIDIGELYEAIEDAISRGRDA